MARKARDYDAELQTLLDKTKKVKTQKTVRLGELVQTVGADVLPQEALAGVLLAAVEQAKTQPEAVARWAERGQALFQQDGRGKRGSSKAGAAEPAAGPSGDNGKAAAAGGAA